MLPHRSAALLLFFACSFAFSQPDPWSGAERMAEAYKTAGGSVEYVLLPDFKKEGHSVFGDPDGRALWADRVAAFLQKLE